jgi:phage terminase large subunit
MSTLSPTRSTGPKVNVQLSYKPNLKQQQFHGLTAKYRGFCGGWGNGKTSGGCAEFFLRLIEYPGTNSIIARKTRPELRATTWDMLVNGDTSPGGWEGIPKVCIKTINKSDLFIELWNGSKVHGLPLDDPKKLENFNLGLFMIDQAEEVEEDVLLKFHGRLRQHNSPREGLLLFNPDGHNHLWRRFIDPERKDSWKAQYKAIEASPFDNPNLPADYLEQFDQLPKHWYDRYVLGSHDVFVGQIFTEWHPDSHVIEPFHIPKDWERWCCIDPGIRHEGCVSWMARDYLNNWYYYREILEAGHDIAWWADTITETESRPDWGGPDEEINVRLIGPEAQQRAQTDGRTVMGVFQEEGIDDLEISDRDPVARISRIASALRPTAGHARPDWAVGGYDDQGVGASDGEGDEMSAVSGAPRLYVFSDCAKLQEYLPQYRWRPQRTNFTEEAPPEAVRKKDDHNIDCLGHILVAAGDSDPEVPDNSKVLNSESREADEHFDRELALAGGGRDLRPAPWRNLYEVGDE